MPLHVCCAVICGMHSTGCLEVYLDMHMDMVIDMGEDKGAHNNAPCCGTLPCVDMFAQFCRHVYRLVCRHGFGHLRVVLQQLTV